MRYDWLILALLALVTVHCGEKDSEPRATGTCCTTNAPGEVGGACYCWPPEKSAFICAATDSPLQSDCSSAAVGPRATCCQNESECFCAEPRCAVDTAQLSCSCTLYWATLTESTLSCAVPTFQATRCCLNAEGDVCGCDQGGDSCEGYFDDSVATSVSACDGGSVSAVCPGAYEQVASCAREP